ncbi:hypothetical protein EA58_14140 [Photobacterium galatheae]|uniref:Uncharacterized protein n=2 Tax=Photobacterium galatheae TaxID=1654360 RepID=A0A066RP46_9GAMM|nr:hypothetical protein EA58_14140 [Photobacterium galatheae]
MFALLGSGEKPHKINLSHNEAIQAQTEAQLMKSVSVSEDELNQSLKTYREKQEQRSQELKVQENQLSTIQKSLVEKEMELVKTEKALQQVNQNIQDMKDKARILKEQHDKKKELK